MNETANMGTVPLSMTTFFEEFLFRGFIQSRMDRQFGWGPAIFVSGAMFSLYHLGYPGFRTWEDILLLFAAGIGFTAALPVHRPLPDQTAEQGVCHD